MTAFLTYLSKPSVALGGALVIALLIIAGAWLSSSKAPSGTYVAAAMAPITAQGGASSDLSFQLAGQVTSVPVAIGQSVTIGQTLVALDQSALSASRAGAAANLAAAEARLAALTAGTRPEQVAIDQTAVTQAQEALRDAIRTAYITADDAVHNKADQFIVNPRSASPQLAFTVPDQTLANAVQQERADLEAVFSEWGTTVNGSALATEDPIANGARSQVALAKVGAFLDDAARALSESPSSAALPLATLQGYEASITAARQSISGSMTSITGATTALKTARGVLTLAQAGATSNDLAAAQAAVDAARATLSGIDVQLGQSVLRSPVSGIVTQLNARVGQTVVPGQIVASVESAGGSKASALVVPSSSVITDNGQSFVYVDGGKGGPVKTPVTIGLVGDAGTTEIVSGVSAGTRVLTFGNR